MKIKREKELKKVQILEEQLKTKKQYSDSEKAKLPADKALIEGYDVVLQVKAEK